MQLPVTMLRVIPENRGEYVVSVLRVIARKEPGEPMAPEELEAVRTALRLFGQEWR